MSNSSASVYATVEVEVFVGAWEQGSTFESLREQITREAHQKVQNILARHQDEMRVTRVKATRIVLSAEDAK